MSSEQPTAVPVLLHQAFEAYLDRRLAWYARPKQVLRGLLDKDGFAYALRGIKTGDDFAEQAFYAHEAASEETMMGNAWQAALAAISPNSVGGGDMRTERDGILWIIQIKTSRGQNAGAEAQDLRSLKSKLAMETDHHPGRKNVMPMMAFVRGPSVDEMRLFRATRAVNNDIDMFQFRYLAGTAFLKWCNAEYDQPALLTALSDRIGRVQGARSGCLAEVQALLRERLLLAGRTSSIESILEITH
jgi:hypothetical protein